MHRLFFLSFPPQRDTGSVDITLLQLDDRAAPLSLRMTGSDAGQTEKTGA